MAKFNFTSQILVNMVKTMDDAKPVLVLSELESALECPVCRSVPQSVPIYQCENGHILCKMCRSRLKICPSCRGPLGKARNLFAESMLERVTCPCQHAKRGCKVRLPRDALPAHHAECKFIEIMCPDVTCTERVLLADLGKHFLSEHDKDDFRYRASSDGVLTEKLKVLQADFRSEGCWISTVAKHNDNNFIYQFFRNNTDGKWFTFVMIGERKKIASTYIATITAFRRDTGEEIIYKGPVNSAEVAIEEVYEEELGLIISDKVAKRLILNDHIDFKIIVTPKDSK
jgi:hypothetical protein